MVVAHGGRAAADDRHMLVNAQKHITSREILLWMTPSEAPKASQASECNELLGPTGAICWIIAQRQPGKFTQTSENICVMRVAVGASLVLRV